GVIPDIMTIGKGMGNGFPIGGVLISPEFEAKSGMLGTTFGGNYLACAAGIAVLDVIKSQKLIANAEESGNFLIAELKKIDAVKEVRGLGLMIGVEFDFNISDLRKKLLYEKKIFTGVSGTNILRLLPPLILRKEHAVMFLDKLKESLVELS
ncbi:MAG TPA: aminotransferase class III-fold pyridoxal phosphate-dependent enzyme, partial [Prolixibacteraceae bacterium]|nr:aminotransferase class III-fold pyridoxal phosphate-dependent enzyme [Prolixibacteraceae bacterium]